MKINNIHALFLLCVTVFISMDVCSYEIETHEKLTQSAVVLNALYSEQGLLNELGIIKTDKYPTSFGLGPDCNYMDLMKLGAKFEDGCVEATGEEVLCEASPKEPNGLNGFNHF